MEGHPEMAEVTVRRATAGDRRRILQMTRLFQLHLSESDPHGEVLAFRNDDDLERYVDQMYLDVEHRDGALFVADVRGEAVAFVLGITQQRPGSDDVMYEVTHKPSLQGWVGVLFVEAAFRRSGIGSRLMDEMLQHFIDRGCSSVHLLVAHANAVAVEAYRRYGLRERDVEMSMSITHRSDGPARAD